jgi:hypothetical protein
MTESKIYTLRFRDAEAFDQEIHVEGDLTALERAAKMLESLGCSGLNWEEYVPVEILSYEPPGQLRAKTEAVYIAAMRLVLLFHSGEPWTHARAKSNGSIISAQLRKRRVKACARRLRPAACVTLSGRRFQPRRPND